MDDHRNTPHTRQRRRTPRAELIERWAALVSAVVSLIVALYALRIAQRTDANVAVTVKSISTRYIGQFPDILPEIVNALRVAHSNISILTDVPGYAIYSAH